MVGIIIDHTLSMVLWWKEHPGFVLAYSSTHTYIYLTVLVRKRMHVIIVINTVMQILWKEIVQQYSYHFNEVIRLSTHVASCCIYIFTIYLEKQAPGTLLEIILSSLSIGSDLNAKLSIFNFSNVAMYRLAILKNLHMYSTIFQPLSDLD